MSENTDPLDEALNRILPELRFEGHALEDVIQFLRDVAAVNIHVNWRMLEVCGIYSDAKVTVSLVGATFGKVLETILYDVDGGMIRLGYRDGLITISTQEDLARHVITKVYDVHDLVVDQHDDNPPAQRQELETARLNGITNVLVEAIAPETWNFNGGHGSIGAMDDKLVIGQTPENHRAIKRLLEQLRDSRRAHQPQGIEPAPTPPAGSQEQAGLASPEEGSGKPNLNEVIAGQEQQIDTALELLRKLENVWNNAHLYELHNAELSGTEWLSIQAQAGELYLEFRRTSEPLIVPAIQKEIENSRQLQDFIYAQDIPAVSFKERAGRVPEVRFVLKSLKAAIDVPELRSSEATTTPVNGAPAAEPTLPSTQQTTANVTETLAVEAIGSPDSTAPPVPPEKPKAQADKPNDPHAADPFPPGEFVEPQSGRRYDFGGNLVLWELWKVLCSARAKLTVDHLYSSVPTWRNQVADQGNVHRALHRLRVFWRTHKRDDFAKAIRSEGGFICPVNLRADA